MNKKEINYLNKAWEREMEDRSPKGCLVTIRIMLILILGLILYLAYLILKYK